MRRTAAALLERAGVGGRQAVRRVVSPADGTLRSVKKLDPAVG